MVALRGGGLFIMSQVPLKGVHVPLSLAFSRTLSDTLSLSHTLPPSLPPRKDTARSTTPGLAWTWFSSNSPKVTPRPFLSSVLLSRLELSETQFYEPSIRALLGTASHYCEVVVLRLRTVAASRENNLNYFQDFDLIAKARIWSRLPYGCDAGVSRP